MKYPYDQKVEFRNRYPSGFFSSKIKKRDCNHTKEPPSIMAMLKLYYLPCPHRSFGDHDLNKIEFTFRILPHKFQIF